MMNTRLSGVGDHEGKECQLMWTEMYAWVTLVRAALSQPKIFATYWLCKKVQ